MIDLETEFLLYLSSFLFISEDPFREVWWNGDFFNWIYIQTDFLLYYGVSFQIPQWTFCFSMWEVVVDVRNKHVVWQIWDLDLTVFMLLMIWSGDPLEVNRMSKAPVVIFIPWRIETSTLVCWVGIFFLAVSYIVYSWETIFVY